MRGAALAISVLAVLLPSAPASAMTLTTTVPALAVDHHGSSWFVGGTGRLRGLYRTDGTIAGTRRVVRVNGGEAAGLGSRDQTCSKLQQRA